MATTNVTIRIDSELKAEADELFASLGMNTSVAFKMFLSQAIAEQGLPFRPTRKISDLDRAINDFQNGNFKTFDDLSSLMEELDED